MSSNIIKTTRTLERKPARAFLLSLLVPGLGQLYTGSPARGITLLFFRILPLWALPFYAFLTKDESYVTPYLACSLFALAIHIASPLDAMLCTKKKPLIIPGRANSMIYYCLYGFLGLLALIVSYIILSSFFFLYPVPTTASPLFSRGDLVLISRLKAPDIEQGQSLLHTDGSLYRLMAAGKDRAYLEDGILVINGIALNHAVPDDGDMKKLGQVQADDLYWEIYGTRRYLIVQKMLRIKTYQKTRIPLKAKEFLLAKDIRKGTWLIKAGPGDILGRVEGIVFSWNVMKMFF